MSSLDQSKILLDIIPRTMRNIRTEIRKVAGGEFTIPQYRLLGKISREPGCSNRDLADWMGVSTPTMSKMVDKLVDRKLVLRMTDPAAGDRRHVRMLATAMGAEKASQIRGVVQRLFAQKIDALPVAKARALAAGLQALKELFP
jgi:DNA-binding MarR family transcriptional regulator